MPIIYLIRHGETDWNLQGRIQGTTDVPLNDTGRQQARAVGRYLADRQDFERMYTSGLTRAAATGEIIAEHVDTPMVRDDRLREMDFGAWEGLTADELEKEFPSALRRVRSDPVNTPRPGGESTAEACDRILECMEDIAEETDQRCLVVSHGGVLRALITHLLGMDLRHRYRLSVDNASISVVEFRDDDFFLHRLNQIVYEQVDNR